MAEPDGQKRVERQARLRWIPIASMKVNPLAQRELNQARVDKLAANFDLERLGNSTVNERDDAFYLVDGQHRIAALKEIGWGDQQVQCWTYAGMTEAWEAEMFLKLNDVLAVKGIPKYRAAVHAGRSVQCDIDRLVRALGLSVSKDKTPGAISAVGALERVYCRSATGVLSRTLRIITNAYGDPGLSAAVIDGIGHLCQRYNGQLDEPVAVERLAKTHGGVNGLLGKAEKIRRETGNTKGLSVAAAAVEIINAGRGGKKLPDWWK